METWDMHFYDALTNFIFVEDQPDMADYIFVPGSGYGELAIKAAQLYHSGYAGKIVVSGKYSILGDGFAGPVSPQKYVNNTYKTECDFLTDILKDQGVPKEAIMQERNATYTYENAICIQKLLRHATVKKAILVCQTFHARRSLLYFQLLFPETKFLVCPAVTQNISKDNWFLHPDKIDVVLGEVERCGSQFHQIMREELAKNHLDKNDIGTV